MRKQLTNSRLHFIGIGGIGMCGLAELLHNMGVSVSGSDVAENDNVVRLQKLGVPVYLGHQKSNLRNSDVVIYSSAIKAENPELVEAHDRGLPILPRAQALAELMSLKRGIAIAGSHGKTTTSSLVAAAFLNAQVNPTVVVGGKLNQIASTATLGTGEWFIAEADESDGSFLRLSPEIVVITNIDNDHLDYYGSLDKLAEAFVEFAQKVPFFGVALVWGDDPRLRQVFAEIGKPVKFYGLAEDSDYYLKKIAVGEYVLHKHGTALGILRPPLPGAHNALNSLVAMAVALEAGVTLELAKQGIENFQGVGRRFQWKGARAGIDVFDDYGHHPTEVRCVLDGFREKFSRRRLVVCFQPHRYSRTQLCWLEFLSAFSVADHVIIRPVYAAGEVPVENISSERLVREMDHPSCEYMPVDQSEAWLGSRLKTGDVFITLGAGDGWKLGEKWLALSEH